jgi:hypothetical protein
MSGSGCYRAGSLSRTSTTSLFVVAQTISSPFGVWRSWAAPFQGRLVVTPSAVLCICSLARCWHHSVHRVHQIYRGPNNPRSSVLEHIRLNYTHHCSYMVRPPENVLTLPRRESRSKAALLRILLATLALYPACQLLQFATVQTISSRITQQFSATLSFTDLATVISGHSTVPTSCCRNFAGRSWVHYSFVRT